MMIKQLLFKKNLQKLFFQAQIYILSSTSFGLDNSELALILKKAIEL